MAVIETWYNQDLQQPVKVHYLDGSMFSHNGNGNRIGVHVFNNGEPVTLSGTVSGYVVTSDGATVPCTGSRSGNNASILIPAAAYQPGAIFITVFLTDGSTVTTLASVATNVLTARTGNQVSPGSVVTDWTKTINAAMQSVENATENLGGIVATPYASLTFPVPFGKYTYYNGNLYRCISPIATSEEFTAAHWTQVRLGDDVSDLKSAFETIDVLYTVTWENGGLNYSNGGNVATETRIRSAYIPYNVKFADVAEGYKISVYGWNASGVYQGVWNGTSFSHALVWFTQKINIADLQENYKIRFMVGKTTDASITVSDASNVSIIGITDTELELSGKAADAKVTGKRIQKFERLYENTTINKTAESGGISSEDGSVVSNNAMRHVVVDLTDKVYLTLKFDTTPFSGNVGYGFMLSDNTWSGVRTTSNATITIDVPADAVEFRSSWNIYNHPSESYPIVANASFTWTDKKIAEYVSSAPFLEKDQALKSRTIVKAPKNGGISSENGSIVGNNAMKHISLDLVNEAVATKLTFRTTPFSGNVGYGFLLSDNTWEGVRTTGNATVTIDVPDDAIEFRTSWNIYDYTGETFSIVAVSLFAKSETTLKNEYVFPFHSDFDLSFITASEKPANYMSMSLADMYALYDSLVTDYPLWVTKTDCSDADTHISVERPSALDNMPIYLYRFSPVRTDTTDTARRLKIYIVGGTHPNEKMGIFQLYNFLRLICANWKTEATCGQLRTMVDFYIMPCLSPWGFAHTSRVNENGVNLNRNFPTANWEASGSGTTDYTGPTAGSEYETQISMYYLKQIMPDAFWDLHTGGMTAAGRYGAIECDTTADRELKTLCISIARAITNAWIAENSNFPNTPDKALFGLDPIDIVGEHFRWAFENITKCSILTELSVQNKWVNGVLSPTPTENDTPVIWKENLQSVYNTLIRLVDFASQKAFKTDLLT